MEIRIRKYTLIAMVLMIAFTLLLGSSYRNNLNVVTHDNFYVEDKIKSIFKIEDKTFQIFKNDAWQDIELRGMELMAFTPGYTRKSNDLDKEEFQLWLQQIHDLEVNLLYIPYLQTDVFYEEIYKFNTNNPKPLYVLQGIPIDEDLIQSSYDAFSYKLSKSFKKDIKMVVDAMHGRGISFENHNYHSGFYIRDISPFVFGYIIGNNSSPEFIHLTNTSNPDKKFYKGNYFSVNDGSPIDCFIAETMDYLVQYESSKYNQKSTISYYSSPLSDPLEHEYESNFTRFSTINLEAITQEKSDLLFSAYELYPNSIDFLPFENFEEGDSIETFDRWYTFLDYIKELEEFHTMPIMALSIGTSTSRVEVLQDSTGQGFQRGGLSEKEQGEQLIELLKICYEAKFDGVVLSGWQDNWSKKSPLNYVNDFELNTSKFHNAMASEENTGLLAFEFGEVNSIAYIDGDPSEWTSKDLLFEENEISLYAKGDTSYLYLMIKKIGWSLSNDSMVLAVDISNDRSIDVGSDKLEFTEKRLPMKADFLVNLTSYTESEIRVQERNDIFSYLYKYYTNLIDKKSDKPSKDSPIFDPIFQLNRKNFELKSINKKIHPLYSDVSELHHGNGNPKLEGYNSLSDFSKNNEYLELRIPWSLLNIIDPVERYALVDCYGVNRSQQIGKINSIQFALYYETKSEQFLSDSIKYTLPEFRNSTYHTRLKESYVMLKKYWKEKGETT